MLHGDIRHIWSEEKLVSAGNDIPDSIIGSYHNSGIVFIGSSTWVPSIDGVSNLYLISIMLRNVKDSRGEVAVGCAYVF
ncbi:MAG: hypothetical protein MI725_10655, partial [Pirellulales bacterium]|nr:hypothetical protein [Pirellulales bacterium]